MYNGIGLLTARGSGTSGYVQRNLSAVRKVTEKTNYRNDDDLAKLDSRLDRKPNAELIAHNNKRRIELKCMELQTLMEDQGYDDDEIEKKVSTFRKMLLEKEDNEPAVDDRTGRLIVKDTHQIAEVKQKEIEKLRNAFGIRADYVQGSAFDSEAKKTEMELVDKSNTYGMIRSPSHSPAKKEKCKKSRKRKPSTSSESEALSSEASSSDDQRRKKSKKLSKKDQISKTKSDKRNKDESRNKDKISKPRERNSNSPGRRRQKRSVSPPKHRHHKRGENSLNAREREFNEKQRKNVPVIKNVKTHKRSRKQSVTSSESDNEKRSKSNKHRGEPLQSLRTSRSPSTSPEPERSQVRDRGKQDKRSKRKDSFSDESLSRERKYIKHDKRKPKDGENSRNYKQQDRRRHSPSIEEEEERRSNANDLNYDRGHRTGRNDHQYNRNRDDKYNKNLERDGRNFVRNDRNFNTGMDRRRSRTPERLESRRKPSPERMRQKVIDCNNQRQKKRSESPIDESDTSSSSGSPSPLRIRGLIVRPPQSVSVTRKPSHSTSEDSSSSGSDSDSSDTNSSSD